MKNIDDFLPLCILPQAAESKSGLVKTIFFTPTCIKIYNPIGCVL